MDFYCNREKKIIFSVIVLTGLILFFYNHFTTPEFRYFWDSSIRWRQLHDLVWNHFSSLSCRYPALEYDAKMIYFPSDYISSINGKCYYWFSPYTAIVFAPIYSILGTIGPHLLQHFFITIILLIMTDISGRLHLKLPFTLLAIILFRFGTAAIITTSDIESHIIASFLFCTGLYLTFDKTGPSRQTEKNSYIRLLISGITAGSTFAFRPEMLLMSLFMPAGFYFFYADKTNSRKYKKETLIIAAGALLAIAPIIWTNLELFGHFAGVKSLDAKNDFLTKWVSHTFNIPSVLIFSTPLVTNGLLAQMPLAVLLLLYLRKNLSASIEQNRLTKYSLSLLSALIPIAFVTPASLGGPYIGFRFAFFLYPLIIVLILKQTELQWQAKRYQTARRFVFAALYGYTIIITGIFFFISRVTYKEYNQAYLEIKKSRGAVMIARDTYITASLFDEFYRRPVLLAKTEEECLLLLKELKKHHVQSVDFIRFKGIPLNENGIPNDLYKSIQIEKTSSPNIRISHVRLQ